MIKLSTGLVNNMLGQLGLKEAMNAGCVEIYTGAQPATADAAPTGTLLAVVTKDAGAFNAGSPTNGLTYSDPVGSTITKSSDNWKYVPIAAGVAGWARVKANAVDNGGVSATALRIDMSVASAGGDMTVVNPQFTVGVAGTIDQFSLTFPMQ